MASASPTLSQDQVRSELQDQIRCLEYATVKAPYEILNKKYRQAHKTVEKESNLNGVPKAFEQLLSTPDVTTHSICDALGNLECVLADSKRKILTAVDDELEATKALKTRNDHLKLPVETKDVAVVEQWKNTRSFRFIAEYLLRTGYYNTALQMIQYYGIEHLVNLEIFLTIRDVEQSLRAHSTRKALEWCIENRSRLKKHKSNLEFSLRTQDFIELVKLGKKKDALDFARKHFRNLEQDQMPDLQKMMLLLGFRDLSKLPAKYKPLLCESRWSDLIDSFRQDVFKLFQIQSASLFALVLQAGLSALKTHSCFSTQAFDRSPLCPVCHRSLNRIAGQLPSSHHSHSKIRCRLTGHIMDDTNPPLMLPNGQVYSYRGLADMARHRNNEVTCPVTGESFRLQQCEKVFLM